MEWPLRRQREILYGVGQRYPVPYSNALTRFVLCISLGILVETDVSKVYYSICLDVNHCTLVAG